MTKKVKTRKGSEEETKFQLRMRSEKLDVLRRIGKDKMISVSQLIRTAVDEKIERLQSLQS